MKTTLTIAVLALLAGCNGQRATAETQARAYLRELYPGAQSRTVACTNIDTDDNGYVNCDAVVDGRAVPIECAANANCLNVFGACNEGCKARPLIQIQQPAGGQ